MHVARDDVSRKATNAQRNKANMRVSLSRLSRATTSGNASSAFATESGRGLSLVKFRISPRDDSNQANAGSRVSKESKHANLGASSSRIIRCFAPSDHGYTRYMMSELSYDLIIRYFIWYGWYVHRNCLWRRFTNIRLSEKFLSFYKEIIDI